MVCGGICVIEPHKIIIELFFVEAAVLILISVIIFSMVNYIIYVEDHNLC